MKKVLSYVIEGNKLIVTGDSSKEALRLPVDHKRFEIGDPYLIDFVTPEGRAEFFRMLLQANHSYTLHPDEIVIEDIVYDIHSYCIESLTTKRSHIFPSHHARNLFKEYQEFLRFHLEELMLRDFEKLVKKILEQFNIDKSITDIVKTDQGIIISVIKYSYNEQKYPNFQLLLSPDKKLKFLHFLEDEGEIYHSGDEWITRNTIEWRLKREETLLIKFDELTKLFDLTL